MITIQLNSQPTTLTETCTIQHALILWGYSQTNFAVAVNQNFIPQTHYAETFLQQGDLVDVVAPMQGG